MAFNRQWEVIERKSDGSSTARMMVPNGWLVRSIETSEMRPDDSVVYNIAMTFVPDPEREWILVETA